MRRVTVLILAMIFLLALALRLWGIDNGLPQGQVTDESADISTSLRIAAGESPTYTFHRVGWPIAQLPLHALHFAYLRLTESDFNTDDFEARYFTHRGDFVLSTRVLLATLAALTIIPAYFVGYDLTNRRIAGFATALILAIHPMHAYLSHLALPDAYAVTWVTATLLGTVGIARTGKRWAYLLAGVGAALTILTRVQAITIGLPVLMAHLYYWYRLPQRPIPLLITNGLWAMLGFAVAMLIFNPFIVIAPGDVLDDLSFIVNERYGGTIEGELIHAEEPAQLETLSQNIDLPLVLMRPYFAVMALGGLLLAGYRRDWVLLVTVGAFWAVFTLSLLPAVRPRVTYWMPAIAPTAILVGYLTAAILKAIPKRWAVGGSFVLAGCLLWAMAETIQIDRALARQNTRIMAYDFVTNEIPADSRILIGDPFIYSVPLDRNEASMRRMQSVTELPPTYEHFLEFPLDAPHPQYDLFGSEFRADILDAEAWQAFVAENDIEYIIEADYCNPEAPLEAPIPDEARDDLTLLYVASPFASTECETRIENRTHMEFIRLGTWQRAGPIIRIYAR